jgi:hypothetical protein
MYTNALRVVALLLISVVTASGCATRSVPAGPQPPIDHVQAPAPLPKAEHTTTAEPAFDPSTVITAARSAEPRTTVAALVIDRTTGEELVAIDADRPFRSASLVKLLIAIDALERHAATGKEIAKMLSRSDDAIASRLWVAGDGPTIITRTVKTLGLKATRPPRLPGRWGDVLLTAHDVARIYDYVLTSLPDDDRALIVDSLAGATRVAADGFNQYFGIPDGLGGRWAIKQGWSDSRTDLLIHSSGLVGDGWRYVVVVLTEHPLGVPVARATGSATAAAKALSSVF